ncbi:MAG TPA: type II toxin-antitoxin system prevent-host-death family antitoxin [Candidatus Dormibacteraeota bacterium]
MTRQMTATEFKAKALAVLDQVGGGEEIEITKHGRTVARLIAARGPRAAQGRLAGISKSAVGDEHLFSTGSAWDLP